MIINRSKRIPTDGESITNDDSGRTMLGIRCRNRKDSAVIMDMLKLCESDYRFMLVVWDNAPVDSGTLVRLCAERLGWKKPTTYTVLRKMCERGLLKNENAVVSVIVPKERVQRYESGRFIDHAFEGSLPSFLAAFLGDRSISESEAEELKRLIDQHTRQ